MRALVLGAQGMLGSALVRQLARRATGATGVDVTRAEDVELALLGLEPDVVVNCAGIVKSECGRHPPARVWAVNGEAPHMLAEIAHLHGARFVHVSTDCIFSGRQGNYREEDRSDADDLYGRSKAAGEIADRPDCLTIRTSFIGRDPRRHRGLLEWLLTQEGAVPGYVEALWSGLSAAELARAIERALTYELSGLYHVAGPAISKADLLETLVRELGLRCRVERVDEPVLDRSLDGSRFAAKTGYSPPTWAAMCKEIREEIRKEP